ncbi:hypothetical protein WMY93_007595 [Mugilogobius chulae]|uniref:Methyltransferase domain-containing protein n=1 Tax=Mugilogobius chulae TaxID=88201 RepID=A0AAW0PH43_9GOBI
MNNETDPMAAKSFQEVRQVFITCFEPQYDNWAPDYEQNLSLLEYKSPEYLVTVLMQHFTGDPAHTRVLDVACGSGLVAKKMVKLGFRQFVGVDASEGMLKEAENTKLYQDLQLAVLGKQPLSVEKDSFDVVTVSGGFNPGFIPIFVVRELCEATKPGGLVCISRGNFPRPEYVSYHAELEEELTKMESEGLWTRLTDTKVPRFVINTETEELEQDPEKRDYVPGTVYVFKKSN